MSEQKVDCELIETLYRQTGADADALEKTYKALPFELSMDNKAQEQAQDYTVHMSKLRVLECALLDLLAYYWSRDVIDKDKLALGEKMVKEWQNAAVMWRRLYQKDSPFLDHRQAYYCACECRRHIKNYRAWLKKNRKK